MTRTNVHALQQVQTFSILAGHKYMLIASGCKNSEYAVQMYIGLLRVRLEYIRA